MNNITVYVLDMPEAVKGLVRPTPEGDYLIFMNARYNAAQQQEIYEHEVRHLLLGHHCAEGKPIGQIELEAGDKTALLSKIKQVERSGLPLTRAIVAPAPQQLAPPTPWGTPRHAQRRPPKKAPPGWRPPRESPWQRQARLVQYMEEEVQPRYRRAYAWVAQLKEALGLAGGKSQGPPG